MGVYMEGWGGWLWKDWEEEEVACRRPLSRNAPTNRPGHSQLNHTQPPTRPRIFTLTNLHAYTHKTTNQQPAHAGRGAGVRGEVRGDARAREQVPHQGGAGGHGTCVCGAFWGGLGVHVCTHTHTPTHSRHTNHPKPPPPQTTDNDHDTRALPTW